MHNPLYTALHEENLHDFNRLLMEADQFDENLENNVGDTSNSVQEDAIFDKVKQENEDDVQTNAYEFLARQEDGTFAGLNDVTNTNDPAIIGLCAVMAGDIMTNSENAVEYVTALFDHTGVNDISKEEFAKVKAAIWKKLGDIPGTNQVAAYGAFSKFVIGLVNGVRANPSKDM